MSIHPAEAVAVQAHADVELTAMVAVPPSLPKVAERGVTLKLQVGVGAGPGGAGEGTGVVIGGWPGSGVGAGVGGAPCVMLSRIPLIRMAPMRRSLDAFAVATMTSVPSPCPLAGDTCNHDD